MGVRVSTGGSEVGGLWGCGGDLLRQSRGFYTGGRLVGSRFP